MLLFDLPLISGKDIESGCIIVCEYVRILLWDWDFRICEKKLKLKRNERTQYKVHIYNLKGRRLPFKFV